MIIVDTDVLAIHLIFTWDRRREENERVYELLVELGAKTTIYNLLELCGLLALAKMECRIRDLLRAYLAEEEIGVEFPSYPRDWGEFTELVVRYLERGFSCGDALVALSVEAVGAETFVTWNKKHFGGKIGARVLTPSEFLREFSQG